MDQRGKEAAEIQRRYYTGTAASYDTMHAHEGDADPSVQNHLYSMIRLVGAQTVLDVGAGTGRGIQNMLDAMPHLRVLGVDPVAAVLEQALRKNSLPAGSLIRASGEALPFLDRSFDVVCSSALLHHVPDPDLVVREMLRVARKAVLIADSNRFGQGARPIRFAKLAIHKLGLWGIVNYLKTAGKGYSITEGDGLAYSYSIYDSFDALAAWADRLILIPAGKEKASSWLHPLLNSSGVLVCALKEPA